MPLLPHDQVVPDPACFYRTSSLNLSRIRFYAFRREEVRRRQAVLSAPAEPEAAPASATAPLAGVASSHGFLELVCRRLLFVSDATDAGDEHEAGLGPFFLFFDLLCCCDVSDESDSFTWASCDESHFIGDAFRVPLTVVLRPIISPLFFSSVVLVVALLLGLLRPHLGLGRLIRRRLLIVVVVVVAVITGCSRSLSLPL